MASKKRDGLYKRGRYWWASRDPVTGRALSSKCTGVDAARAWLRERELLANDPSYSASKTATLGEWTTKFLALKSSKSKATQAHDTSKIKAVLSILPPETNLSAIGPGAFDEYVIARRASKGTGKSRGPGDYTIRRELNKLIAVLSLAKRSGCYPGDLDALMPSTLEGHYQPVERSLTEPELAAFMSFLPNVRWRSLVAVCVAVGCRLSEACKLTRSDIDLGAGLVRVRGTKTEGADRDLPILSCYRPLLELAMPALPIGPISNIDRTFKAAAAKAGIKPCSPNDLRRTHSTLLGTRGVNNDQIAKLLGHTTTTLAARTYNQVKSTSLATVIEAQLAQAEPIMISTESLQIGDTKRRPPKKRAEKPIEQRPPEPKVGDSNSPWRAENPGEPQTQGHPEAHGDTRVSPHVTTNKRQSGDASPSESPSTERLALTRLLAAWDAWITSPEVEATQAWVDLQQAVSSARAALGGGK